MEVLIIKIVLAVIFALAVAGKLTGKTKSTFEAAGLSPAIMYAIAIAEIVFTIGLFTKFALISALGLLAIIAGAVITLFRQKSKLPHYTLPGITLFLLLALVGILLAEPTIF